MKFSEIELEDNLITILRKKFSIDSFYKILFLFSLFIILSINIIYSKNPLLDQYGFRQTQTALTSYYLKVNSFSFDYESPVIGKPWAIPFEFPIFQQIVASCSNLFDSSLTQIGRLVSLIFLILTCVPIFFTLLKLKVDKSSIYFSLTLFLSSPIYLFWAGTFMIEGAALFFAVCFLYFSIDLINRNWSVLNFVNFSLFLLLALLQKITTVLPIVIFVSLIITFHSIILEDFRLRLGQLFGLILSIILPLLLAYIWIKYTDLLKQENPIGLKLTSKALSTWNYGTLDLRLSKSFWLDVIFNRNIKTNTLYGVGLLSVSLAYFLSRDKLFKFVLLGSCLLFLFPFLLFSNLHSVHTYYQFANSLFLSIAVGMSVCFLCSNYLYKRTMVCGLVLLGFIFSNYVFFYKTYYHDKTTLITIENNKLLKITDYIKKNTPINKTVIWYGFDWSSEPAFYSERKSLTVPDWDAFISDSIRNTNAFLKNEPVSAIVLCPMAKFDFVKAEVRKKYPFAVLRKIEDCEAYLL